MKNRDKYQVCVPVATVWTTNQSAREIDQAAIACPARLDEWLITMDMPDRLDLCTSNRVQTQVLFGEDVLVLEEKEDWVYIIAVNQSSKKDQRGYPGWIPRCQITLVSPAPIREPLIARIISSKALLTLDKKDTSLVISYQTSLPVAEITETHIKVDSPIGEGWLNKKDTEVYTIDSIPKKGGADITASAEKFLELPYLWGGMSSFGYDCSGFAYSMLKANGYLISRDAGDQAEGGIAVSYDKAMPGDLLFFAYEEGRGQIHHVGIYYGDDKMIHSPKTGEVIEITSLHGKWYEKELCAIRRYWQEGEKG